MRLPSEEPFARDAELDALLESPRTETPPSDELARLAALLAASAAPSGMGPQPGEAIVLAAFRELVTEGAGTPSLAARRARLRVAAVAAGSTLALLGGGVAAAATGSLPSPLQSVVHDIGSTVGVPLPAPNHHAGTHPYERGHSGKTKTQTPGPAQLPAPALSAHASHPPATPTHPSHPAHPTHPATPAPGQSSAPGNSGVSRHHGNPVPTATAHPTAHHGKPAAAPLNSRRSAGGPKTQPHPNFTRMAVTLSN